MTFYLYVIGSDSSNTIKVGISKDPMTRIRQLQTGNHEKLQLIDIYGPWPELIARAWETHLHRKFKSSRVTGEWFSVSPDTVSVALISDYEPQFTEPIKTGNPQGGYEIGINACCRRVNEINWPDMSEDS